MRYISTLSPVNVSRVLRRVIKINQRNRTTAPPSRKGMRLLPLCSPLCLCASPSFALRTSVPSLGLGSPQSGRGPPHRFPLVSPPAHPRSPPMSSEPLSPATEAELVRSLIEEGRPVHDQANNSRRRRPPTLTRATHTHHAHAAHE